MPNLVLLQPFLVTGNNNSCSTCEINKTESSCHRQKWSSAKESATMTRNCNTLSLKWVISKKNRQMEKNCDKHTYLFCKLKRSSFQIQSSPCCLSPIHYHSQIVFSCDPWKKIIHSLHNCLHINTILINIHSVKKFQNITLYTTVYLGISHFVKWAN